MAAEPSAPLPALGPARLAAIRARAARTPDTAVGRAFQDLLDEIDRLRPLSAPNLLSPPEKAVVIGLARGETASQTAKRMGLSFHTVRTHRFRVKKRLGAVCGAQVVAIALANGWLTRDDLTVPEGSQ